MLALLPKNVAKDDLVEGTPPWLAGGAASSASSLRLFHLIW